MSENTNPFTDDPLLSCYSTDSYELKRASSLRKTMAERLSQSQSEVPHFYLSASAQVDGLLALRKQLTTGNADTPAFSVNDFMVRAYALALSEHPNANASWTPKGIMLHKSVNLCVAIATEEGLIAPILRGAESLDMNETYTGIRDLVDRSKRRTLKREDVYGGTASISNLGGMGVEKFNAIINPPQAIIVAIGAIQKRAIDQDGSVVFSNLVEFTISVDHRVLDGADAAKLISTFKNKLENPETLMT